MAILTNGAATSPSAMARSLSDGIVPSPVWLVEGGGAGSESGASSAGYALRSRGSTVGRISSTELGENPRARPARVSSSNAFECFCT